MRLPDVYIIGAQKAGTTTLYDWLAQHPQIFGDPLGKDFPFFSQDSLYRKGPNELAKFSKGAKSNQLVLGGEANAMFIENSGERLYEVIPEVKLIAILRNPVDRAYSAYCYAVERLLENRTFEEAINYELKGGDYTWFDSMQKDYLKHGLYAKQIKNILKYYSRDQLHIVIFEELQKKTNDILKGIFKYIGIDPDFIPIMTIKNITKGGYRLKIIGKLINLPPSNNTFTLILKKVIPFRTRVVFRRKVEEIIRIKKAKPEFPENLRKFLKEYYKNEIKELENILERKIYEWI